MNWQQRLAAIRKQAASNCGLTEYPAELVAAFEAFNVPTAAWGRLSAEHKQERRERLAAAREEFGKLKDAGRTACAAPHKDSSRRHDDRAPV